MGAMRSSLRALGAALTMLPQRFPHLGPQGLNPLPIPTHLGLAGFLKAFGSLEPQLVGEWLFHGPASPIVRHTPEFATSLASTSRKGSGLTRPDGNSARIMSHCARRGIRMNGYEVGAGS